MKASNIRFSFDFSTPGAVAGWRGINDVVMGGKSTGEAVYDPEGGLVFIGNLSLKDGGGFSSITSPLIQGLNKDVTYLVIKLRGDGKTYKFSLRTEPGMEGVSYQTRFRTKTGRWETRRFRVSDFRPTWHGTVLEGEPPPVSDRICRFGFLVADLQEGPFRLEIKSIEAV